MPQPDLDALAQHALLRLSDAAYEGPDPLAVALATPAAQERLQQRPPDPILRAWLQARGRFNDAALRRALVPEGAQVVLIGPGLEAALLRMPAGLITPRAVHLIDHAAVLQARQERLQAAGRSPLILPERAADPDDLDAALDALLHLPLREASDLSILLHTAAPRASVEQLLTFAEGVQRLPGRSRTLAFSWFTPDLTAEAAQAAAALVELGRPWPLHPLGVELALQSLGDTLDLHTAPLLRRGELTLTAGTRITWRGRS